MPYVFRELVKEDLVGKTIKDINRPVSKKFQNGTFSMNVLSITFEDGATLDIWSRPAEDKLPYISTKMMVFEKEKHESNLSGDGAVPVGDVRDGTCPNE